MKDELIRSQIHQAVDYHAENIQPDPFLAQRVMNQERRKRNVMKRISVRLVIAIIILLLLTATALALTNWETLAKYFEKTRSMATSGELDRYSEEDQLKLLSAMTEAGLVNQDDPRLITALDEKLSVQERAQAANDIISERYGQDYFNFLDIENIELSRNSISEEDREAYDAWSEESKEQMMLQSQEPINETRTYRDVASLLTEIGMFPHDLIRDVKVSSEYSESEKRWTVIASVDKEEYIQSIRRQATDDGNVFSFFGYSEKDTWNIRFYLDEYGNYIGIYNSSDPEQRASLSLGDAYPLALAAAQARLHVGKAELEKLELQQLYADSGVYDLKNGNFRAACDFTWYEGDTPLYSIEIDAENGQVLKAINWMESAQMREKEKIWVDELTKQIEDAGACTSLINKDNRYFWNWSIDEKAAWSQIAYPVVQQYYAEHPEFCQYLKDIEAGKYLQIDWPVLCVTTQYLYGVPDNRSISMEQAFEIARDYAISQGARESDIDENKNHTFYYDVTDPAQPVWKIDISLLFGDGDLSHQKNATEAYGFFVVIDAHTGEILHTIKRDVDTAMWKIV